MLLSAFQASLAPLLIYPCPGQHDLCWYGQAFADHGQRGAAATTAKSTTRRRRHDSYIIQPLFLLHSISVSQTRAQAQAQAQTRPQPHPLQGDAGRGCRLIAKIASRCFNATRPWRSFAAIKMKAAQNGGGESCRGRGRLGLRRSLRLRLGLRLKGESHRQSVHPF